jgi:hypothetical protein
MKIGNTFNIAILADGASCLSREKEISFEEAGSPP